MFNFFHKNKAPRPIFEALEADIHCHLLPCVDDGSSSFEETFACLDMMKAAGFSKAVCTPHFQYPRYPNDEDDIRKRFSVLKDAVARQEDYNGVELIGIAGEYRVDAIFDQRVANPRFLRIIDHYVLTELSLHQQVMGLEEKFFNLQMKGYDIILAHPERYPYLNPSSKLLERFKEMGVMFQVNILSLTGFYGESCRRKAYELLERRWVELLGTDMHNNVYAHALLDATHDRKIEKVLDSNTFLNKDVAAGVIKHNKL